MLSLFFRSTGKYMSGLLSMTREEASKVMTGLVVGVVLGALISFVFIISALISKCRSLKGKNKAV